jgi:hypothetical protein
VGDAAGRLKALERVVELRPDYATALNDLAWTLVTTDVVKPDYAARAVKLAERAVEVKSDSAAYQNTLGVARLRAGDLSGAAEALGRSMELGGGGQAIDWLAMALVEQQLDREDKAREWLAKADAWIEEQTRIDRDTRRFRAEVAAVLDATSPTTEPSERVDTAISSPVDRSGPAVPPNSSGAAQTTP